MSTSPPPPHLRPSPLSFSVLVSSTVKAWRQGLHAPLGADRPAYYPCPRSIPHLVPTFFFSESIILRQILFSRLMVFRFSVLQRWRTSSRGNMTNWSFLRTRPCICCAALTMTGSWARWCPGRRGWCPRIGWVCGCTKAAFGPRAPVGKLADE